MVPHQSTEEQIAYEAFIREEQAKSEQDQQARREQEGRLRRNAERERRTAANLCREIHEIKVQIERLTRLYEKALAGTGRHRARVLRGHLLIKERALRDAQARLDVAQRAMNDCLEQADRLRREARFETAQPELPAAQREEIKRPAPKQEIGR